MRGKNKNESKETKRRRSEKNKRNRNNREENKKSNDDEKHHENNPQNLPSKKKPRSSINPNLSPTHPHSSNQASRSRWMKVQMPMLLMISSQPSTRTKLHNLSMTLQIPLLNYLSLPLLLSFHNSISILRLNRKKRLN